MTTKVLIAEVHFIPFLKVLRFVCHRRRYRRTIKAKHR